MTVDRDLEDRLRSHLEAEVRELPFLVDPELVHRRLGERRGRWWRPFALIGAAAAVILAVVLGQPMLLGSGQTDSGDAGEWGPLSVMDTSGGMDALTTGVLRITEGCVTLETAGGDSELLVWPADRAEWDPATRTIRFTNPPFGPQFTLRDGQPVSLGGGGDSAAEGGVAAAEWVASIDWVAAPDLSCPMEIRWFVSSVAAQGPAAGANVVVGSDEFPGIEIACRGELFLGAEECRAWGEELLGSRPPAADDVTLLLLTANVGDARCAADFYVAPDGPVAVSAAVPCPAAPTPLPSSDLVGIVRGEPELEGGVCPVLLTDADGERWEVYLPEPYRREYRGDVMVIIGPEGEVVARTGDRVGFDVERDASMGSYCQAGVPVQATAIVFVQPQDEDPAPPMQNALEAVITDALAVLGIQAQRAEYSLNSAFMWAPFDDGAALYVHALPTDTDRGEFSVLSERVIGGQTVLRVEYESGLTRDRFECEGVTYGAEGATPPGFATFDDFLAELIPLVGCGS